MATVAEIQARLAREAEAPTAYIQPWPTRAERDAKETMNRPVRKVSYPAVAGAVTAIVLFVLSRYNIVLDPASAGALVVGVMAVIGYFVPLSDKDLSELQVRNELG